MKTHPTRLRRLAVTLVALIGALTLRNSPAAAQEISPEPAPGSAASSGKEILSLQPGTLISVSLDITYWKHVHKGDTVLGRMALPVYTAQQAAIAEGAPVRLTIDSIKRVSDKAGAWKSIGRRIVRAFNPLESGVAPEYCVKLKAAEMVMSTGETLPISVRVLRAGRAIMIFPNKRASKTNSPHSDREYTGHNQSEGPSRMLLRLEEPVALPASTTPVVADDARATAREAKGRAFLLDALSAAQNREGDRFQAVLVEPVRLGPLTFGPGSIVEGRVVRSTQPRTFSRAGSLYVRMDRLVSPEQTVAIDGALDAVETSAHSLPALDEEGILHGRKPGVKNALMDLGIAYTLGKGVDDLAETPIRAVGATMSDAAVANAARYFGLGASAIFLVTRHGRDVRLPKYAEIEIDFGRVNQATASPK